MMNYYSFYVINKPEQQYAILSVCDSNSMKVTNFIIDDNDKYKEIYSFINKNIYDFKKQAIKSLLVGWNNKNAIDVLFNILNSEHSIYNESLFNYALECASDFYIADLYQILNISNKYNHEPEVALRYMLMVNDIALINKNYTNREEAEHYITEIVTGIAILIKQNISHIEFAYKYSKHYKNTNVTMTPAKASIKRISTTILGDDAEHIIKTLKPLTETSGSQLTLLDIPVRDNKVYNNIRNQTFKLHEKNDIGLYKIANNQCKISKVGLVYTDNKYYVDDTNNDIIYIDIKSFYTSILCNYSFVPRVFKDKKDVFINYIEKIRQLKETDSSGMYKEILTTIVGKMLHTKGILNDPVNFYNITINGVLLMINLLETIHENVPTVSLLNVKIDGAVISLKKNTKSIVESVIATWSKKYNLTVKIIYVHKLFMKDLNNKILVCYDSKNKDEQLLDFYDIQRNPHKYISMPINKYIKDDIVYRIIANGIFNQQTANIGVPRIVSIAALYNLVFNASLMNIIANNTNKMLYSINHYNANGYELVKIVNDSVIEEQYNNDMIKVIVTKNKNDYIIKTNGSNNAMFDNNKITFDIDSADIKHQWYISKTKQIIDLFTMSNIF